MCEKLHIFIGKQLQIQLQIQYQNNYKPESIFQVIKSVFIKIFQCDADVFIISWINTVS
jgi:hypothetical protein